MATDAPRNVDDAPQTPACCGQQIPRLFGWQRRNAATSAKSGSRNFTTWIGTLLVAVCTTLAHGQIPIPTAQSSVPKPEAVATTVDQRTQIEAQLSEARRRQETGHLEEGGTPGAEELPASDRQRLFDRLVIAYSEQLKLLDELESVKTAQPDNPHKQTLMAEFAGPPPYSALRVDALRDLVDSGKERLHSLASTERALETLKVGRLETQQRAAEAVRLAEDKLARADGQSAIDKERLGRELAILRRQLAEAELANIGMGLERVRLERKGVQALNSELERLLTRVRPEQRLGKEELEQQQALLRKELNVVIAEIDALVIANGKRSTERQQLNKLVAEAGSSASQADRLELLDARLETDRVLLLTLTWLQTTLQVASDAWAQRYVGFHSEDANTRQSVISGLSQSREELAGRKQIVDELQQAARVAVREQQLRLGGTSLDPDATDKDSSLYEALQQRARAYQRLQRASARMERQLDRWLDDFGFTARTTSADDWQLGALQLAQTLKSIWNFEMFAVEDSTVIDGKTVTVTYGVTVGKSIGALLLFLFGYWLFALLSRRLQRVMVSRFGVNEQMASVIRRWAMISLAVALIIFILNLARIPLTVFAFMGGALAIGIGFGTQTIIKNVISGIIILFERKIRVGDIIALGGMTGHVIAVDLRASTVRGFDGVEALVPNSSFLENQVVNWTYSNPRIRREIRLGIAYGSPIRAAAEIIARCAEDHAQVLKDPPPEVFFEDFGDNALLLVLVFWVELGPNLVARRVDSDLRHAIGQRLEAAGIPIPFPQRDVHLDISQPLPVRLTRPPADNV
jgi:potassium efflux system protein